MIIPSVFLLFLLICGTEGIVKINKLQYSYISSIHSPCGLRSWWEGKRKLNPPSWLSLPFVSRRPGTMEGRVVGLIVVSFLSLVVWTMSPAALSPHSSLVRIAARRKDYEWDKRDRIIMETVKPRAWDRKEWLQVSSCLERSHDSNPWNPVHITHSLTVPTVGHPGSVHYKKIKYYLRLVRARRRIPQGEPSDRGVTVRSGSTSSSINKLYDLTGFISYLYDITVILLFVSYYLYFFYFCFSVSRDYWKEIKEAEIQIIRIW